MSHKNKTSKQDSFGANFKFNLLSVLQNSSQKGSTLAVGVGLGALMIAGTTMAIATSSQNKTNVVAQEQTAQAVAQAEAGIATVQAMLVENPTLALFSKEDWEDLATGQTTIDQLNQRLAERFASDSNTAKNIGRYNLIVSDVSIWDLDTNGNSVMAKLPNSFLIAGPPAGKGNNKNKEEPSNNNTQQPSESSTTGASCTPLGQNNTDSENSIPQLTEDDLSTITALISVPNSESEEGIESEQSNEKQFELISYQFDDSEETGTLTVEGKSKDSKARIQVKFAVIPPEPGQVNLGGFPSSELPDAPGLWAQNFSVSGGGNQTINSDILDSSDCVNGVPWTKPPSGAFKHNGDHVEFNKLFPPLPLALNNQDKFDIPDSLDTITSGKCTLNPTGSSSYEYTGGCGSSISVDVSGNKTVTIYSDVAVPTIQATGMNDNPGRVIVYSNDGLNFGGSSTLSNADQWKHIQYYVASGDVLTRGNLTSSGFIFAPKSEFRINGGGNGTHTGPIWAETINVRGGGNSTMNPSLVAENFEYLELFKTDPTSVRIGSIQGYERVEASNN
ncbi:hypothetical protein IQ215_02340 [Cyanobacterium stanieri LEGE 03274]|uniref:DUF7305 domain-containing protein n=1 Tax=Cyanobacterium stanieri LEGE 03274 TaxID=1828756 RepID=A0ABR9V0Z8_9CHRO|nr:hypothetical protein [Cyanobacterium stanieri]MBE9221527.1 hypothetical protein [Cyanobacterium stanieri LEGE 03274]